MAWRYLGYQPSCSMALLCPSSFPCLSNQCEILSKIDSSLWLLIPTLSCHGVKVWALNCLTVESSRGKRSKIPIAFAMSSFVFEQAMVIAHVLFHILKDAASVPCFSAVLQHYKGQEIRESLEDELKRITGEFEVSIFALQCHMIFLVSQFRQATLRGVWKISMKFFTGTLASIPNHSLGLYSDCFLKRPWCLWQCGLKAVR